MFVRSKCLSFFPNKAVINNVKHYTMFSMCCMTDRCQSYDQRAQNKKGKYALEKKIMLSNDDSIFRMT